MLSSVLLPEPDGPDERRRARPAPRSRSTPSSARVLAASPYSLTTPSTARTARRRLSHCGSPWPDRASPRGAPGSSPRGGPRRWRARPRTRTARRRAGPGTSARRAASSVTVSNSLASSAPSAEPITEPAMPKQAALDQEHALDPPRGRPDGAEDPDLARLLDDRHDEHAGDAERHRDDDEELDHGLRARLRRQPGEQLGVDLHPAIGAGSRCGRAPRPRRARPRTRRRP